MNELSLQFYNFFARDLLLVNNAISWHIFFSSNITVIAKNRSKNLKKKNEQFELNDIHVKELMLNYCELAIHEIYSNCLNALRFVNFFSFIHFVFIEIHCVLWLPELVVIIIVILRSRTLTENVNASATFNKNWMLVIVVVYIYLFIFFFLFCTRIINEIRLYA